MADSAADRSPHPIPFGRLHSALLAAFPTPAALAQLTKLGLGVNLSDVTSASDDRPTLVFNLLQWAEAQDRMRDLLTAAIGQNRSAPGLRDLCQDCQIPIPTRPDLPLSSPILPAAAHRIPAPPAGFTGRATEVARLVDALTAARAAGAGVGLIQGLGGVGKTALALTVAQAVRPVCPRQVRLDLAGAGANPLASEAALGLAAYALGYPRSQALPDSPAARQQLYCDLLGDTPTLILADDAAGAAQVRPLLPPAGHVLLITSRQRFALAEATGPARLALDVLPPDEAAALLVRLCARIGADAPRLAGLCGYLPKALEISAGVIDTTPQPVAAYLARLADTRTRLQALHNPDDPQANVAAAFALSYDALDPAAQATLAQLSVFPAPFDAPAAEAVVALPPAAPPVAEALTALYRRSLLDWDGTARYRLHDLVRAFAAAQLTARDAVALRHAAHYATVAQASQTLYLTKDRTAEGLTLFDSERQHIDTGWAWTRAHADSDAVAAVLLAYADATVYIGDLRYHQRTERIPQLEASLAAARRLGHKGAEGSALGNLGLAYADLGEVQRAIGYHEQHLAVAREIADRASEGWALGSLGSAYADLGEARRAIGYHEQHLAVAREIGDRLGEGTALGKLGNAYKNLGEAQRAIGYHKQHLAVAREIGIGGVKETRWATWAMPIRTWGRRGGPSATMSRR